MKSWVRKTISVGVLAAGALLLGPTAAQADTAQISAGNDGVLNGTQVHVPIQVPVNVCGNAIGVLAIPVAVNGVCANGAVMDVDHKDDDDNHRKGHKESKRTEDTAQISNDNDGVLNGTQVYVPIQVPVNVCGNAIGVLAVPIAVNGACVNGAVHDVDHKDDDDDDRKGRKGKKESVRAESKRTEDTLQWSGDNDGVLNGTQVYAPIQIPINVCGNAIGVLAVPIAINGACINGAIQDADFEEESSRTEDTTQISHDNDGVLNGTQVYVPIQIPINVCGNAIGVLAIPIAVNGACVNGAVHDVDVKDDDDDDDNGDHDYDDDDDKKKGKKSAGTESLPLVGSLPGLGAQTGSSLGSTTSGLSGNDSLNSGVKTSQVNVAGVDPTSLLSKLPA
ncbi:chaplin family protein [Actinomycetes bacterium KLBMP 9797]